MSASRGTPRTEARVASLLEALVDFARLLRAAGVTVGTERVLACCRAAAALGPAALADIYWAGRLTLAGSRDEIAVYDRVFAAYFLGETRLERPPSRARVRVSAEGGLPGAAYRDAGDDARQTKEPAPALAFTAASPAEVLRQRSFEQYTEEEHALARAVIERLAAREPRRVSRRTRPVRRRGIRPDLPRTLRRALRTDGEPLDWSWRRRRTRPRRVVLVLDVSGSMGSYARSMAQFAHAAVLAGRDVEAFAFGTRLTRLTSALRSRDRNAVLDALGRSVPDWQGGTRIGESLEKLVEGWGRRGPLRGAVVVILSDGLERGEPAHLALQMQRLARLAHRVVWLNPLKGGRDYAPLARGMAAALPHIDFFLPGHNLASLEALAGVLAELGA